MLTDNTKIITKAGVLRAIERLPFVNVELTPMVEGQFMASDMPDHALYFASLKTGQPHVMFLKFRDLTYSARDQVEHVTQELVANWLQKLNDALNCVDESEHYILLSTDAVRNRMGDDAKKPDEAAFMNEQAKKLLDALGRTAATDGTRLTIGSYAINGDRPSVNINGSWHRTVDFSFTLTDPAGVDEFYHYQKRDLGLYVPRTIAATSVIYGKPCTFTCHCPLLDRFTFTHLNKASIEVEINALFRKFAAIGGVAPGAALGEVKLNFIEPSAS